MNDLKTLVKSLVTITVDNLIEEKVIIVCRRSLETLLANIQVVRGIYIEHHATARKPLVPTFSNYVTVQTTFGTSSL